MLRSINDLKGFDIVTTGGEVGDVKQFYFDDERWTIRHLAVNTGDWVSEHQVLISPFSVTQIDRENRKLHVALTKEQVESSPDIDTLKPVSRQIEAAYSDYYGYSSYWRSPLLRKVGAIPDLAAPQTPAMQRMATSSAAAARVRIVSQDVHLHSMQEVAICRIVAKDGLIGYFKDFIVDAETWAIRYLLIHTRNWLLGKEVLIAPRWISSINWEHGQVQVNLSRDAIWQSPDYDSARLPSREYAARLHRHYHQLGYGLATITKNGIDLHEKN